MNRRRFIDSLAAFMFFGGLDAAAGQLAPATKILKPPVLRPGDVVGIVSPSTQVTDPDLLVTVQRTVDYFGLKAKWGKHVRSHRAQDIASVEERVEDLHSMFADPEVRAVFCSRGGYGAGQLLADLDYKLIAANPKIFAGYSDITALHLAIHKMTGLVTFHGPVLLSQFTPYTLNCFRRAVFQAEPLGRLLNPDEPNTLRPKHTIRTFQPGKATGRLIGGNLSLIAELMGTPYEIDTRGRVFFTEDVGEEPYRIDRMLTQLRLAGKLKDAVGIVFGECADCDAKDYKPSLAWNLTFGEVLNDRFEGIKSPVMFGLTIGHTGDQLTLPLGVTATLDSGRQELIVEESATI
jgi:muramoyltetrapeptide carboxypeptidase